MPGVDVAVPCPAVVAPAGGQAMKRPCASRQRVVVALAGSASDNAINEPIKRFRMTSSTAGRADDPESAMKG